ncbi:helix-turn-helix domain-containing protein [Mycobacteroides abscessus]|nr:helix-turn-helix domain-containing protein [Mycobacteroides abscessus]
MVSGNNQGQFLRAVRDRAQMSQRQLARLAGYSDGQIQHFEAGRRRPSPDDLGRLARHLGLSSWETHYLYALGGKLASTPGSEIPDMESYLESLNPHPAAYLSSGWTVEHANSEFERIFKGLWISPNFLNWHYVGRRTPDIILDWASSSDWLISWLKFNLALSPDDPDLQGVLDKMTPITSFSKQWDRNTIPADPASKPWTVRDLDNDSILRIDMRVWRAGQSSDLLLLGVIRETADT